MHAAKQTAVQWASGEKEFIDGSDINEIRATKVSAVINTAGLACFILSLSAIFRLAFPICIVAGESMTPGIRSGNWVIASSLTSLDYGDIVLADTTGKETEEDSDEGVVIIKRIIAMGGDTVYAEDDVVYVNGDPLDEESYVGSITEDFEEITVPEGEYFLLGDNREISMDSRYFGTFSEDEILGEVLKE